MKPDIKERWLEAILSEEYDHLIGEPWLCKVTPTGDEYGILGVLCEVLGIHGIEVTYGALTIVEYGGESTTLTPRILSLAGMPPTRGNFIANMVGGKSLRELSQDGVPWSELARLIEEKL